MSDTLYIQTDKNVEVHHPHVYLQDIAKLSCSNSKILNRLRVLSVANLKPDKPGRYVISVMDLIHEIQEKSLILTFLILENQPSSSHMKKKELLILL